MGNWNKVSTPATNNRWQGKIWNVMGDSISMDTSVRADRPYHIVLRDKLGFSKVNGYGTSGSSFVTSNPMVERVKNMATNADLITVWGGTNDFGYSNPLGTPADRGVDTFYGCMHNICQTLQTTYPHALHAFFTPMKRERTTSGSGYLLTDIRDIIVEVADEYSIPVLDLTRTGNLYPMNTAHKDLFVPDALHPNNAGHARLSTIIENFLMTL